MLAKVGIAIEKVFFETLDETSQFHGVKCRFRGLFCNFSFSVPITVNKCTVYLWEVSTAAALNVPNWYCLYLAIDVIGLACLADDVSEADFVARYVFYVSEIFDSTSWDCCVSFNLDRV